MWIAVGGNYPEGNCRGGSLVWSLPAGQLLQVETIQARIVHGLIILGSNYPGGIGLEPSIKNMQMN